MSERQVEDRALHEVRRSPCLVGANDYPVDADVVLKTSTHYDWREPTGGASNVQEAMTSVDKVGALLHPTHHAHL